MKIIEKPELGGLGLTSCNYSEAAGLICEAIEGHSKKVFIHLNYYNLYILKSVNLIKVVPDENKTLFFEGIGMKTACTLKGWGMLQEVNGTDLFPVIAEKITGEGYSIFFLGAGKSIISKAVEAVKFKYENLRVAGFHDGFFSLADEDLLVETINNSNADLLLIGMGMAKEAEFLGRNYHRLDVKSIWAVGGLFDFLSGAKPRAPKFIRLMRLEWLFRLIIEPKKKFKRIFIIYFRFLYDFFLNRKSRL